MARKKKLIATTTMAPQDAAVSYTSDPVRINGDDWTQLSYDLYQSVNASLGERGALEQNLRDWNDLYEMRTDQLNYPWENASNIFIPLIPAQLNAALSYIVGKVFIPRFYIVSGNTPESASAAHQVERYYNAELVRQRGQTTWFDQHINWVHEALRDGTAVMEVLWRRTKKMKKVVTFQAKKNTQGTPILDPKTGQPKKERAIHEVEVIQYDDVELQPVLLRDFLLIPAEATSIEQAVGVGRACWMYEDTLNQMVREGILNQAEVELALQYDPIGNSDIASDRQGVYDKTMGDQITPGLAQGAQTSRFFANRGPIKVWRIHTNQYDMNMDGEPEENIFWLHELSQRMLGWTPYEYITEDDSRPFFAFSPDPRPDRFYGWSMVERLAPIQAEVNAMFNQRNNLIDLMLRPPIFFQSGEDVKDNKQKWEPGARWVVSNPQAIKFMEFPQVPLSSFQMESLLMNYADKLTGMSAPAMGAAGPSKRSATDSKIQAAATTTRNDLVALRLRVVCRAILNFVHCLKKQYLDDDPNYTEGGEKLTIPREILAMDMQLDIAGSSDPLDASSRRQETIGAAQFFMGIPWIGQDRMKSFGVVRKVADTFNWPDAADIIGTAQDAEQAAKQMQQQQEQEQQFSKMLEVAKVTGGKGGGGGSHGPPPKMPPKAQMQRG